MAAKVPHDVSQITDYLYLSAWPRGDHSAEIRAKNIHLILSMHWVRPSSLLEHPPTRILWLPTIDTPWTPMPIYTLRRGVEAALPVIHNGFCVLVHCKAGVHRSVAMTCAVLIGMGYSADEAMALVTQKRKVADPHIWYVEKRIYKFERYWRAKHPA